MPVAVVRKPLFLLEVQSLETRSETWRRVDSIVLV